MGQFLEERKRETCSRNEENDHKSLTDHPEPVAGDQILCADIPGTLIRRPRLHALLNESLKSPLTLISAPAGFGKTTLLSTWTKSLPATKAQVAWLSLDEGENDPQLFWTYILSALDQQQPEAFYSSV